MSARTLLATLAPVASARHTRREGTVRQADGQRLTTTGIAEADDETLVALVVAGDQRAFAEVVRRHGGRLRAIALRFAGAAGEADDIVQDAFVSFWRTAPRWKPGGPPLSAYLMRIAVNRAIDGDRKRRVRRFFGIEDAGEVADPDPPADDRMAERKALGAVVADVKQLPARQRAAILLAADGERSNVEIAGVMGLTEGAVEQLLVRARRTLRARLAEREQRTEHGR